MKLFKKLGIASAISLSLVSLPGMALPNTSIDVIYKGEKLLDHQYMKNAHRPVGKVDDAKKALESDFTNTLLANSVVTSVYHTTLDGNLQLKFTGAEDGIVYVTISGIGIDAGGIGKKSGIKFDWDVDISNVQVTGEYSFLTGELTDIHLQNGYTTDVDFEAKGVLGFIIDLFAELNIFDANRYISKKAEEMIEENIEVMFEDKFSNYSKSFFGLDEVIPGTIMFEGENIAPELKARLVKPIDGKSVTISTNLDNKDNQTLTVNLWNDFIVTARRIKPVAQISHFESLNCSGSQRQVSVMWNNTDTNSTYNVEYSSGQAWYNKYSGSSTFAVFNLPTGTQKIRVNSKRQGVQGDWNTRTYSIPGCSSGGNPPVEMF